MELAVAQLNSLTNSITRVLPPGISPPNVLKYNASTVSILQPALDSETLTELDDAVKGEVRQPPRPLPPSP